MEDLMTEELDDTAGAHIAYHLRMAAVFAVAGEPDESAAEAVLAWTMLVTSWAYGAESAGRVAAELVDREVATTSPEHRLRAMRGARARAMDIESHFVMTGQRAEADLYAQVAEDLERTIETIAV